MTNTQKAKVLARLQAVLPSDEWDATLMSQLVDDAEEWVLAYTNRTNTPDGLLRTIGDLAIIAYNRLGTEGDAGRSEAGESYSFETAPAHVYDILRRYLIARCGGHAHETKASDE